ncbi:MAG TPA: ATPase domain-containing protein [Candidatus Thermoplasmatota archaeon]|nr:ATPase domain-containing protein [Candidatus Thermoplasmatota archaeon]
MTYRFHLERDELAERLGGGLPKGALVVMEGEFGTGKSIVVQRMVYGLLRNSCRVTYVSTELTTLHFIEQMHTLDYAVEEFIFNRSLLFLPVYPVLGFRGNKADLMDRLLNAKRMYASDVIVIDAFSSIVKDWMRSQVKEMTDHEMTARIEDALYHFKLLNAKGKSVILTFQPGDVPDDIAAGLKAAADAYLSCKIDNVGGVVSRSIFVRRFGRAERPVADIIPFRVEPKTGFIVEIKSVS